MLHYPSIFSYMLSSMAIMWFNKQVLAVYNFPSVAALMVLQSILTIVVLLIVKNYKLQVLNIKQLRTHFLLFFVTIVNIFFGLIGASLMPAAMFTALRRLSILFCMYAQQYYLNQNISSIAVCSVWATVIGASIASANDFNFNITAYMYVFLNNVFTAGQQILTQVSVKKLLKTTLVLYNSIFTVIFGMIAMLVRNDLKKITEYDLWNHSQFIIVIIGSSVTGIIINYSVVWCIEQNGALTLAVSGSIKNIVIGLLSCARIFDHEYIFNWRNFVGLQFAAVASLVYVYAKSIEIKTINTNKT